MTPRERVAVALAHGLAIREHVQDPELLRRLQARLLALALALLASCGGGPHEPEEPGLCDPPFPYPEDMHGRPAAVLVLPDGQHTLLFRRHAAPD